MITVDNRTVYTALISENAHDVWAHIAAARLLLKKYMEAHGHKCTDEELDDIYASLKARSYDASVADFNSKIDTQLNKIAYNRNKARISMLWKEQSSYETIDEWCKHYVVPIQWVLTDEELQHISILKSIQGGRGVDGTALHNATQYFESHAFNALQDVTQIKNCFFAQVGESYRAAFDEAESVLISRLRTNPKLSADVYSWANKVGEIRKTLDSFLLSKYQEQAKAKVKTMPDTKLRSRILALLEQNPDLYTVFIK